MGRFQGTGASTFPIARAKGQSDGCRTAGINGAVDPLARTVRNLENLYSVVVAVGLTLAVQQLIVIGEGVEFRWGALPAVIAYVVTLVPFYHGAERHLEDAYVDNPRQGANPRRLLFDFVVLFVEACVLLAAAAVVHFPRALLAALVVLWVIDIAWGVSARLIFRLKDEVLKWAMVNSGAVAVFGGLWLVAELSDLADLTVGWALLAISLMRSVVDYATSWEFYFPE